MDFTDVFPQDVSAGEGLLTDIAFVHPLAILLGSVLLMQLHMRL